MNENRVSPDVKSGFVGVFTSVVVHLYALYAFKSRGFGGEIGLVTVNAPPSISLLHYSLVTVLERICLLPVASTRVVIRVT